MRPFDAGRSFDFGVGEDRCFGGVLSAFRSARWKRSAMPGSSTIVSGAGAGGFVGLRIRTSYPRSVRDGTAASIQAGISTGVRFARNRVEPN
jgi:hypothetical protein